MSQKDITNIHLKLKDLYVNGKYKEYRSLLIKNKSIIPESQFFYNLGTVEIKLKDYGFARYHLENSIIKGNTNTETLHNLNVVKQYIKKVDSDVFTKTIYFSKTLPSDIWVISTLLLLIFFATYFKISKIKKMVFYICAVLISILPVSYKYIILNKKTVAIALEKIDFQDGPTVLFKKIGEIPLGEKLLLEKHNGDWWLVSQPEQLRGWVKSKNLGFL